MNALDELQIHHAYSDSVIGILYASESGWLRDLVTKKLREQSRIRELRVLDVGGGKNSWLGNLVTDVIDINPMDLRDGVTLHQGDVQSASTWDFSENCFDFISCTHMLEDVRDPQRVVDFISKCGRAGFIAVPNWHTEVSMIEGPTWLGNYHHRWILTVTPSGKFEASAKWHYLNHLAQSKLLRLLAKAISFPSLRLRDAVNQIFPRVMFDGYQKTLVADYTKVVWFGKTKLALATSIRTGAALTPTTRRR